MKRALSPSLSTGISLRGSAGCQSCRFPQQLIAVEPDWFRVICVWFVDNNSVESTAIKPLPGEDGEKIDLMETNEASVMRDGENNTSCIKLSSIRSISDCTTEY